MKPAELPHYRITEVRADGCAGTFDPSPWVGEDWITALYLGRGRFLWGRFREVDMVVGTCSFYPKHPGELAELQPQSDYPFMDGYWGERAELVLDESRSWQRLAFQPRDMVVYPASDGTVMGTEAGPDAPPGGTTVPQGWDHDHCEICWNKIGCGGEPTGFFTSPEYWVCEECHGRYVVPRSIAFCR